MWEKVKIINSSIFAFVLPFLRLMLSQAGPILAAAATQAVTAVASHAMSATNEEKRNLAFESIARDLERQGIKVGVDVGVSMINAALELAVVKLK